MATENRLWLHVGPSKTGTSSIQTSLRLNQRHLEAQGILYPAFTHPSISGSINNHSVLARALQQDDRDYVESALAALPAFPDTVISSEGFPKCGGEKLGWLAEVIGRRYRLTVIYYVRDPVDRAVSTAGQAIKGGRATYREILSRRRPRARFRQQIETLADAFGRDRLDVREFSRRAFQGGDLTEDFCHAIGRPGLMQGRQAVRKDGAITMEDVYHIEEPRRREIGETESAVTPELRDATKFFLPDTYLQAVWRNSREDLQWLFESYGIDFCEPRAAAPSGPGRGTG